MVSKRKIEDLILGKSKDITYYNVCKKLEPSESYEKELKYVRKKISEVAPEARPSLEKLLDRMEKLDYSLISEDIKSEYGPLICSLTQAFYYGILEGIYQAVFNKIYVLKGHERLFNIQKNIDNLKTALEYLASGDILERFFKTYLKRVDKEFHNKTGHTISELAEITYKIAEFLSVRGFRSTDRNIRYLLNIKAKNAEQYLDTLTDLAEEESKKVSYIVENLVKQPEQYKKDFEEYIEYKS